MRRSDSNLHYSTLLALIEQIYAAVENREAWQPLLLSITEATRARGASLLFFSDLANGSALVFSRLHPDAIREYNAHYHSEDVWALAPEARKLANRGHVIPDEALVPRREFERTAFFSFLQRFEATRMMHTSLRSDSKGLAGVSINRSQSDGPFGRSEIQLLDALAPHLRRALRMQETLARRDETAQGVLNGLDAVAWGFLLVTGDGRVLHANRSAAVILERRDGLSLDQSHLVGPTPDLTSSLRQLCAECAHTTAGTGLSAGGALSLPRRSGAAPLQVVICPLRRVEPFGLRDNRATAAVFVADPEQDTRPDSALLQTFYGLAPAEAELAARLAVGETVEDIADSLGYTKQTVRWYSKQVLAKTGCRNRAALARQLAVTLASLRHKP